jgi:hypothetical protein
MPWIPAKFGRSMRAASSALSTFTPVSEPQATPVARLLHFVNASHTDDPSWRAVRLIVGNDEDCRAFLAASVAHLLTAESRKDLATGVSGVESDATQRLVATAADLPPEAAAAAMLRELGRTSGLGYAADAVEAWRREAAELLAAQHDQTRQRRFPWSRR